MSLTSQAKFLRVLQEREFQRLGGTRSLKAHIRVVAATNRDLRKAVERGDFGEDLYYRLEVFALRLAPLRERHSDVLPLTEMFLEEIGSSFGRPPIGLTRAAREALLRHDWPGNVRELGNALEHAAIVCEGELIGAEHLSLHAAIQSRRPDTTDLNIVEHATIADVMRDCRAGTSPGRRSVSGCGRANSMAVCANTGSRTPPRSDYPESPLSVEGLREEAGS